MGPPSVSKASTKYPIFAASFAQNNPAILVVGGGGGANRSGVPNAITAFDTTSRAPNLEPFSSIDLPRNEDSVTSLAPLSTKSGSIIYAGINSTEEERLQGKNDHLRAFDLTFPKGSIPEKGDTLKYLSKTSLFDALSSDTARREGYQRLIRLSPPQSLSGGKRLGVVASSLAGHENQLVMFAAVSNKPTAKDIIQRVALKDKEVNDIDIIEADRAFYVAYILDQEVFVQEVSQDLDRLKPGTLAAPKKRYTVPFPNASESKARQRLRCVRFLSPDHLLILANKPNRTGAELLVLKLYEDDMGSIILRKNLGRQVKQAVDMDIVRLQTSKNDKYQIAIAVATQDVSLHYLAIDVSSSGISSFYSFAVYKQVHDVQMTKIVWSPYPAADNAQGQRLIRLASASLSGSIVVDTFELSKSCTRHVLVSKRNQTMRNSAIWFTIFFIGIVLAVLSQPLWDSEGHLTQRFIPEHLQTAARGLKPPGALLEEARRAEAIIEEAKEPIMQASQRLQDLLQLHSEGGDGDASGKAIIVHHDPEAGTSLSTEVHPSSEEVLKKHTEARRWDELSHEQRKRWRDKLVDAGVWAVEEGETILKSIFWSEAGGFVGQLAHGALNG